MNYIINPYIKYCYNDSKLIIRNPIKKIEVESPGLGQYLDVVLTAFKTTQNVKEFLDEIDSNVKLVDVKMTIDFLIEHRILIPEEDYSKTSMDYLKKCFDTNSLYNEILIIFKLPHFGNLDLKNIINQFNHVKINTLLVDDDTMTKLGDVFQKIGESTLIIYIGNTQNSELLLELNDYVVKKKSVLLPVILDFFKATIGPFIVDTDINGCLACSNHMKSLLDISYESETSKDKHFVYTEGLDMIAITMALNEAIKYMISNKSELIMHELEINMLNLQFNLHRVIKLPYCEVC